MDKINQVGILANTIRNQTNKAIESAMYGTGLALGIKTTKGVLVDGQKNEFSGSDCMMIEHMTNEYETGDRVLVALLDTTCVIIGKVI